MDSNLFDQDTRILDRPSPFSTRLQTATTSPQPPPPSPSPSMSTVPHRRNHRSGTKERARKERKIENGGLATTPSTPGTPTGSFYSVDGEGPGGRRKRSHRAGVQARAKRERDAFSMTREIIEFSDGEEGELLSDGDEEGKEEIGDEREGDVVAVDIEVIVESGEVNEVEADVQMEKALAAMNAMNEMIISSTTSETKAEATRQEHGAAGKEEEGERDEEEEEEEEEKAPSLTYDSDDHEEEQETVPEIIETATTKIQVRNRADTGSFQEKIEAELGDSIPQGMENAMDKEKPTVVTTILPTTSSTNTTPDSTLAAAAAAAPQPSKPRTKHQVQLLSLKRPEVLRGGSLPPVAPPKHEVKLLSLRRPEVLKGGALELKPQMYTEGQVVSLLRTKKLKQGDIV